MNQSPVKIWRSQKQIVKDLEKEGTIVSFTIIRVPPIGFENQAPYPIVLVQAKNERLIGQLVDYEEKHLIIGQRVKAVLRRVKDPSREGIIPYGIKFKPVEDYE